MSYRDLFRCDVIVSCRHQWQNLDLFYPLAAAPLERSEDPYGTSLPLSGFVRSRLFAASGGIQCGSGCNAAPRPPKGTVNGGEGWGQTGRSPTKRGILSAEYYRSTIKIVVDIWLFKCYPSPCTPRLIPFRPYLGQPTRSLPLLSFLSLTNCPSSNPRLF